MLHFSIEPLIDLRLLELERGYQPLIALPLGGLELQVMDPMIHKIRFEHLIGYSSHKCFPTLVIRPDRCWTIGAAEHWQMDLLERGLSCKNCDNVASGLPFPTDNWTACVGAQGQLNIRMLSYGSHGGARRQLTCPMNFR